MVGRTLAKARMSRGLSVAQVAEATKLRRVLVEAIERDDFRPSGSEFYVISHLRMIAAVVGLDPNVVVMEFQRQHRIGA